MSSNSAFVLPKWSKSAPIIGFLVAVGVGSAIAASGPPGPALVKLFPPCLWLFAFLAGTQVSLANAWKHYQRSSYAPFLIVVFLVLASFLLLVILEMNMLLALSWAFLLFQSGPRYFTPSSEAGRGAGSAKTSPNKTWNSCALLVLPLSLLFLGPIQRLSFFTGDARFYQSLFVFLAQSAGFFLLTVKAPKWSEALDQKKRFVVLGSCALAIFAMQLPPVVAALALGQVFKTLPQRFQQLASKAYLPVALIVFLFVAWQLRPEILSENAVVFSITAALVVIFQGSFQIALRALLAWSSQKRKRFLAKQELLSTTEYVSPGIGFLLYAHLLSEMQLMNPIEWQFFSSFFVAAELPFLGAAVLSLKKEKATKPKAYNKIRRDYV